ncbi:MAG TPA: signal peptidase I [Streptosporangiaceae bacterium]|nr:signal peptidase I [Streptosporangiaceae bacterium]
MPIKALRPRYGRVPGQQDPGLEPGMAEHADPDLNATQHLELAGQQGEQGTPGRRKARPRRQQNPQRRFWRELVTIVVAAAALTLLVKAFVVQVYRIPSGSMENTLLVGDRVLVNKLVYDFRGVGRGDIVVFSGQGSWDPPAGPPPGNPFIRVGDAVVSWLGLRSGSTYYIKRVIGVPGDRVACCTNGEVTVNGVPLAEGSYLYPGSTETPFGPVTVPAGRLWVMGDNRDDSLDSRGHMAQHAPFDGTIPESQVVGRAFFKIWPLSQFGDLPIPADFQQPALQAGQAAANLGAGALRVVAGLPLAGSVGAAGIVGAPLLMLRHRKSRRRYKPAGTVDSESDGVHGNGRGADERRGTPQTTDG